MLADVLEIRRVVIACGYVDLRKGVDGLAQIIGSRYGPWYRVPLRCDYRCYVIIKSGGEGKVVDSLDIM